MKHTTGVASWNPGVADLAVVALAGGTTPAVRHAAAGRAADAAAGRTVEAAETAAQADAVAVEAHAIAKRYGQTVVLREVGLRLRRGTVHALLGENGAGKSTLVKLLSGAVQPDGGELRLGGRAVALRSVRDAVGHGVIAVHQHLCLFPHLSVHENLSAYQLGSTWHGWSRRRLMPRDAALLALQAVGLDVPLPTPVGALSLGQRHLLEVARALTQRCRVLILDEPTAALSPVEADHLLGAVQRVKAAGVAVLLITHKLDEVEAHADEVTVLRDGCVALSAVPPSACTRADLVRAMLGECAAAAPAAAAAAPREGGRLEVAGLRLAKGGAASTIVVGRGEVVGLTGLLGAGALDIAEAIAGARPFRDGRIVLDGAPVAPDSRACAERLGIAFVPADRTNDGLFLDQPAWVNAAVGVLDSAALFGFARRSREKQCARPWLRSLRLTPYDEARPAAAFSGGNQQKLLLARALACAHTRLLVVLEPTRGVDIGARALIHAELANAARRGVAVIVASTDLDEIAAVCGRAYVVAHAAVHGELASPTRQTLGDAIARAAQGA